MKGKAVTNGCLFKEYTSCKVKHPFLREKSMPNLPPKNCTFAPAKRLRSGRIFNHYFSQSMETLVNGTTHQRTAAQDKFQSHDYYMVDELLTDEHRLIRELVRAWVKKEVSPIIEDYAQRADFPRHLIKGLADMGAFGPTIPEEYGGAGLGLYFLRNHHAGNRARRFGRPLDGFGAMFAGDVSDLEITAAKNNGMKYLPKLASANGWAVLD